MKKKAQIKFGETFAIIILVYIIIVIGMVWYNNINTNKIEEMQKESIEERSFEKYYYIINSHMLHKSEQGDIDEEFDLGSLHAFSNYTKGEQSEYIRKQLGEAQVTLELYNKSLNEPIETITLYNNTYNSQEEDIRKDENIFRSLIPVVDFVEKRTDLGILKVIIYG